jgi:hypothetical protein
MLDLQDRKTASEELEEMRRLAREARQSSKAEEAHKIQLSSAVEALQAELGRLKAARQAALTSEAEAIEVLPSFHVSVNGDACPSLNSRDDPVYSFFLLDCIQPVARETMPQHVTTTSSPTCADLVTEWGHG